MKEKPVSLYSEAIPDRILYPENFAGEGVKAFFTDKTTGIEPSNVFPLITDPSGSASSGEPASFYMPVQKHTDRVIVLEKGNGNGFLPEEGDAVVTNIEGMLIGVQTADCVAILLYDPKEAVVSAVHAGWRGTAKGILKKSVETMNTLFGTLPDNVLAAMGPAIGSCCYEVGEEVVNAVTEATGQGDYVTATADKLSIDLRRANFYQAVSAGIKEENIWISSHCTGCMPNLYHSYRKMKGVKGRQGAFIGLFPS